MKGKNFLSMFEAWQRLLGGETIAAYRLTEGAVGFLRHKAWAIGRTLVDSGIGVYRTYSLG